MAHKIEMYLVKLRELFAQISMYQLLFKVIQVKRSYLCYHSYVQEYIVIYTDEECLIIFAIFWLFYLNFVTYTYLYRNVCVDSKYVIV